MVYLSWAFVCALVVLLAWYSSRMTGDRDGAQHDIGLAIVDFGRAFPNEAIRSLHFTADGRAVFVRLFDNKAGFMRRIGGHFACRLIIPGAVSVDALASGRGFQVSFSDEPRYSGSFEFASTREAAEVGLWLLGNYVSPGNRDDESLATVSRS